MNGTPLVSSVCAFDVRSFGHRRVARDPGEERRGERGHEDRAGQRGPDARCPRLEKVFWRPPTSPLCSSGTDGDGDRAELRRERADAEAGEEHRPGDDLGAGAGVERGDEHDQAEEQHEEPELGDPPRRRLREHLRDPDRGDHQRDRQRQDPHAGVDRGEPERDRQEQRHREEQAGLEQVLEEERGEPAAQQPDPQDRRVEQRGLAGVAAVLLPVEEAEQHHAAAEDQPDHRRQPQPRRARPASGCTKPQVPERRTP